MSSSRLPGKVLLEHNGESMLEIMIKRIQASGTVEKIVVATTTLSIDDQIEKECKKIGVSCFRGSSENVLERVVHAGRKYKASALLVLTGDCPLIAPELISECVDAYYLTEKTYVSNCHVRSYPDGMDVQVVSMDAMETALKMASSTLEKEHSTLYLRRNLTPNEIHTLSAPTEIYDPDLGLTLDEAPDFAMIINVLDHFYPRRIFACFEITKYLAGNPELKRINETVIRKGDN